MTIRNRIKELRHLPAGELLPDPRNWRQHPKAQRDALQSMLDRIGYSDALIARETPDGLMLIDGHLRAGLDPSQVVPVLVTDLNETEAGEMLATLDPLAAMAETNQAALRELVFSLPTAGDLQELIEAVHDTDLGLAPEPTGDPDAVVEPPADPVSKRGDVWMLGKHRPHVRGLSATRPTWTKLLDGATPRLMVTDTAVWGRLTNTVWRVLLIAAWPTRADSSVGTACSTTISLTNTSILAAPISNSHEHSCRGCLSHGQPQVATHARLPLARSGRYQSQGFVIRAADHHMGRRDGHVLSLGHSHFLHGMSCAWYAYSSRAKLSAWLQRR